jgi:hypothetical protein
MPALTPPSFPARIALAGCSIAFYVIPCSAQTPGIPDSQSRIRRLEDPRIKQLEDDIQRGDGLDFSMVSQYVRETKNPRLVNVYLRGLTNSDSTIRQWSADGLGTLGRQEALEPLVNALEREILQPIPPSRVYYDGHDHVRERILWALGMLKNKRALPYLLSALTDEKPLIKTRSAWSLGRLADLSAVPPLILVLHDTDSDVRYQAAEALGLLKDWRAVDPLMNLLGQASADVDVSRATNVPQPSNVPEALLKIDPQIASKLIQQVETEDVIARRGGAWALSEIIKQQSVRNQNAASVLIRYADAGDVVVVTAAYDFFIRLGQRRFEQVLVQALMEGGTLRMANDLLSCGYKPLEAAAREWAVKHRFQLGRTYGPADVRWGTQK